VRRRLNEFAPPRQLKRYASLLKMKVQIAQWIVAAGGSIVAIVAVIVGYLERRQAREDDRLGQTLDYLAGGSQRRSIGNR